MPAPEQKAGTEFSDSLPDATLEKQQQQRRMLIALAVLLIALVSVLIKDRQFWLPPSPSSDSEVLEQSPPRPVVPANPTTVAGPVATPAGLSRAQSPVRTKLKRSAPLPTSIAQAQISPVVITNRAVLPPLEVEVVAGNQHHTVNPGDSTVKLEMRPSAPADDEQTSASTPGPDNTPLTTNAAARVELSPGTVQVVSHPVDPSYPLLAKQMKVQGAVVLEALISKTGSIQDIQILSGPAILSAAAREAVKQWHFKPYYQNGQAVETAAHITVNFTISTY
jgi:periplasmic protein TonB